MLTTLAYGALWLAIAACFAAWSAPKDWLPAVGVHLGIGLAVTLCWSRYSWLWFVWSIAMATCSGSIVGALWHHFWAYPSSGTYLPVFVVVAAAGLLTMVLLKPLSDSHTNPAHAVTATMAALFAGLLVAVVLVLQPQLHVSLPLVTSAYLAYAGALGMCVTLLRLLFAPIYSTRRIAITVGALGVSSAAALASIMLLQALG